MPSTLEKVLGLRRNDVSGAVAAMREGVLEGDWEPEYYSILSQLQDDPSDLDAAVEKLRTEDSEFAEALEESQEDS